MAKPKSKDPRVKEVGDRVKVWDGSANMDKNTGIKRPGIDLLFENEAIIIEKDLSIEYSVNYGFHNYHKIMDLLLKFPTGEEIYCCSTMVKRTDNNTK